MTCPGLHCPGCSGGQSLAILAGGATLLILAAETTEWVAARIFWIGGTLAGAFVLSVAASMWLETRQDRRGRAWGAERGIYSRADYIAPPVVRASVVTASRPAITPPQVTVNIFGTASPEQAAAVRQLLSGQAGAQIITEEE